MSRVINPNAVGKERTQLVKAIAIALRELTQQAAINALTRDLASFIALSLEEIAETIDPSVLAWEKRGYWVKADKFRMEWLWTKQYSKDLREAILNEEWAQVALISAKITERLHQTKVPARHRLGIPWTGAWDRLVYQAKHTDK